MTAPTATGQSTTLCLTTGEVIDVDPMPGDCAGVALTMRTGWATRLELHSIDAMTLVMAVLNADPNLRVLPIPYVDEES